ncbi:amino acid adenylation protein [Brachybacterium ginsengisoli]|uniref:Amino acid adenylation protein n=1 Tax=Brachybacterium ginsengisoli TaxID=1331682 RepID=A0A291GV08_9MICO|nr:amino acid adenylation protein [Brachybacterium ginsengisoli]
MGVNPPVNHTPSLPAEPPAERPAGLLPELLAGDRAPAPSTLVDLFHRVVRDHGDSPAVDSGQEMLTYSALDEAAAELAVRLAEHGVRPGNKVGVRIKSGTTDLYVAILGILVAGAAYVPVDADDPDERARVVFEESASVAVIGNDLVITPTAASRVGVPADGEADPVAAREAEPTDDAWVIFTSGSTGRPKGVAVSHRSAAAFVQAESRMFLQDAPIGPGDRVMAGLSVAFDASCEEMWLAWAYGACLVPAPRSLVRSGVDVGPWLAANRITIVSTVPTLVSLWPDSALTEVRLLIMGGEACPPELAARLQAPGREVWNTYGPTEATVVACGAMLDGTDPVRIGLPLDGWDLAVVDADGRPVAPGASGELIIGGVGLARYLDPEKDAEKYAPMPTLGWERAYRSGDVVVNDPDGLLFAGRADDQIKLGGRRIELGEIDDQMLRLPGVVGAASAVRSTTSGNKLLVGYLTIDAGYDAEVAKGLLKQRMPAALVPRLAIVDELPTRTSGKIDRDALPWPLPTAASAPSAALSGTSAWIAEIWGEVLGFEATSGGDDFFDAGGGSLTAAQVVGRLRTKHPELTVGEVYTHSTLAALAAHLDQMGTSTARDDRTVSPLRRRTQVAQLLALAPLRALAALRWITWLLLISTIGGLVTEVPWLVTFPLWLVLPLAAVMLLPPGRMALAALLARLLLRGVRPGSHPRGGKVHLRLWLAERIQEELAAVSLAGAPWLGLYARLLGARIGRDVDLHSLPPVTGMLEIGSGASIEPEVDLAGHWIDGDRLLIGSVRIGKRARIGARSTLGPGAVVGREAEIAPGSAVLGHVPAEEFWSGSPAEHQGAARGPWSADAPPRPPVWLAVYALLATVIAALPALAMAAGAAVLLPAVGGTATFGAAVVAALPWLPLAALVSLAVLALLVLALTRLLSLAVSPGHHPLRSAAGVSIWATLRLLDEARTWLFPLYAGALTPIWMRLLGARVGRGTEISTVLLIPSLVTVGDHAFLADDTLIGAYELGGGWIRVERVKVGKRAFVGNSGMLAPGRKVPKQSLVAVLSAAPRRKSAKAGSSWLGSPPRKLRRTSGEEDTSLTFDPPRRLLIQRGLVETGRLVPLVLAQLLPVAIGAALFALLLRGAAGIAAAVVLGGPLLLLAGVLAALVTVAAKWLIIGRHRPGEHALFTPYVWRDELADTFTEVLAAPWFANLTTGTVALNVWLRMLGATVGRGVWCDSYWLPEMDLVTLGDGATVNRGCVVQTHLFHDRVLSMDAVTLAEGATLGPGGVILPAATIDRHATVGPVSLVMRGELVPAGTRWTGNPIGPWDEEEDA